MLSWAGGLWIFISHLVMQPILNHFNKKERQSNVGNVLFFSKWKEEPSTNDSASWGQVVVKEEPSLDHN